MLFSATQASATLHCSSDLRPNTRTPATINLFVSTVELILQHISKQSSLWLCCRYPWCSILFAWSFRFCLSHMGIRVQEFGPFFAIYCNGDAAKIKHFIPIMYSSMRWNFMQSPEKKISVSFTFTTPQKACSQRDQSTQIVYICSTYSIWSFRTANPTSGLTTKCPQQQD